MFGDSLYPPDSGMILTKSNSVLNSSKLMFTLLNLPVPHCTCSCEYLARWKPQQLERREPIHSMHENVWHYGAGGVWILILHVNIRMNVFIKVYYVATDVRIGYG